MKNINFFEKCGKCEKNKKDSKIHSALSVGPTVPCFFSGRCKKVPSFTLYQFQPQPRASLVLTQLPQIVPSEKGKH